jgi:AcrR family transcriptional regulator
VSTKVRTADTRERILTAACEVIADIGFEKIRMRMVAERAGVSTALLHYHFDTREKLFTEAMTHSFAHTALDVERDAESAPAAVVLARILRSLLPTDPELHQDWRLWQELWARSLRDETTGPSPWTCTRSCTPGWPTPCGAASHPASSRRSTWTTSAR